MADVSLIVGIISTAAGVGAIAYAHMANLKAERSIAVAQESRDLAAEANEFNRRAEARQTERHDVRWEQTWVSKQHGSYVLIKRGNDVAHHVKATATFNKNEQVVEAETISEDGTELRFRFGSEAYDHDKAALDDAIRAGSFRVPLSIRGVQVRIDWTTELGNQKHFEERFPVEMIKPPMR